MPENEKKGITVKVDAGLHAEVKQFRLFSLYKGGYSDDNIKDE